MIQGNVKKTKSRKAVMIQTLKYNYPESAQGQQMKSLFKDRPLDWFQTKVNQKTA